MRKIKKQSNHLIRMVALLALLLVGVNGAFAKVLRANAMPTETTQYGSNGNWDSSTNTYTWTANSDNLMPLFTFEAGTLSNYNTIKFTVSKQTGDYPYRVVFLNGTNTAATLFLYSDGNNKEINIRTHNDTKDMDFSQITGIKFGGYSNGGSITIEPESVCLTGPSTVTFLANNASWGTVTAKRVDTGAAINSGDQVPHGTQVQFTRTPNTNYLAWRWKIEGSSTDYNYDPSTTITVNENITVT